MQHLDSFVLWVMSLLGKLFKWDMPSTDNTITEIPVALSNREKLYQASFDCIGQRMSVNHAVPNALACVVSFRGVCLKAFGFDPAPGKENTNGLDAVMAADKKHWKAVLDKELQPGDVRIALTVGDVHGHVCVFGKQDSMSNDSFGSAGKPAGTWQANYKNQNFDLVFKGNLGLVIRNYRAVDIA